MADPFDVQLPAQMRLPPVDMSGMKVVGSNVASWFQGNPEMEMRKARLGLEFERVRSQIETQKMDNQVKRQLLREKTQADLWTAQFLAENRFDPEAIIKAVPPSDRATNPGFARNVMTLKNQAALTLAREARTNQEINYNSELTSTIRSGDKISADEAGALFRAVNANGWTSENVESLAGIRGSLNERLAKQKASEQKDKQFSPGPIKTAFDNADAAEKIGNTDEAEVHRAYARSLAGLSSKTPEAIAEKAKAANIKKLQDLDFKLAQELAKHQKDFRVAETLKDSDAMAKAEASGMAVQRQRDELMPQIAALQTTVTPTTAESPASSAPTQAAAKAAEANKIASENPSWTRQQIIEEVEKRFAR